MSLKRFAILSIASFSFIIATQETIPAEDMAKTEETIPAQAQDTEQIDASEDTVIYFPNKLDDGKSIYEVDELKEFIGEQFLNNLKELGRDLYPTFKLRDMFGKEIEQKIGVIIKEPHKIDEDGFAVKRQPFGTPDLIFNVATLKEYVKKFVVNKIITELRLGIFSGDATRQYNKNGTTISDDPSVMFEEVYNTKAKDTAKFGFAIFKKDGKRYIYGLIITRNFFKPYSAIIDAFDQPTLKETIKAVVKYVRSRILGFKADIITTWGELIRNAKAEYGKIGYNIAELRIPETMGYAERILKSDSYINNIPVLQGTAGSSLKPLIKAGIALLVRPLIGTSLSGLARKLIDIAQEIITGKSSANGGDTSTDASKAPQNKRWYSYIPGSGLVSKAAKYATNAASSAKTAATNAFIKRALSSYGVDDPDLVKEISSAVETADEADIKAAIGGA